MKTYFFLESTFACVLGPWPRAFLSLASRVPFLGKAVLGLGLGFFLCPWPWPRALCPRLHLCSLVGKWPSKNRGTREASVGRSNKQGEKVILPHDNFWEDNFFALLVLSSRHSGGSTLGFCAGSLFKHHN